MRIALMAALAASTLAAAPAMAQPNGNAYGHQPKVCLITFSVAGSSADADVVKAQYLPLGIAMNHESRNDTFADIYTYNEATQPAGVDFNIMGGSLTTEEQCEVFMEATEDDEEGDD